MAVVVSDVTVAIDEISRTASSMGGWVVSSNRSAQHQGAISIRVPTERTEEAVAALRALAVEVETEKATSQDVTDEYIDVQARIRAFQAAETQLLEIIQRPGEVADILAVQRELTTVRGEIEKLQGRANFLEGTSATALINVAMELAAATMAVDAGPDQVVVERQSATFRASFTPPEGITEFSFVWDFGNGTPVVTGTRTAPTSVEGPSRTTATVNHAFDSKEDSPYIVTLEITGTGEAGIAKGSDTMVVTVTDVPNIQASAGASQTVRVGEPVTLTGAFTRPEGVQDLTYTWDFGDGLAPVTGIVPSDAGAVEVEHAYALGRQYVAAFTVSGQTSYGAEVTASDNADIRVLEQTPWLHTVWDVGESTKAAVQALGAVVQTLTVAAVWLVVLSPVWAPALIALVVLRRRGMLKAPGAQPPPPAGGAD
jgi:hypothetical protein